MVQNKEERKLSMTKCRLMEGSDQVQSSATSIPKVETLVSTRREGDRLRRLRLITSVLKQFHYRRL
jgi:hypothetical protein